MIEYFVERSKVYVTYPMDEFFISSTSTTFQTVCSHFFSFFLLVRVCLVEGYESEGTEEQEKQGTSCIDLETWSTRWLLQNPV